MTKQTGFNQREYRNAYYQKNKKRLLPYYRKYNKKHKASGNASTKKWREANRKIIRQKYETTYDINTPQYKKRMLDRAKTRAKKYNVPFNITIDDIVIPTHCPIFGVKLEKGNHKKQDTSPSLDRIIPSYGYIKGNVTVICHKANVFKSGGTEEEHRLIAEWMKVNTPTIN